MTIRALAVRTVFLLLLTACGGTEHEASPAGETKTSPAVTESRSAPAGDYDLLFIDAMSKHHEGAVEMARMAEQRAADAKVKAFAQKVIADQQKEIAQLRTWRDQWYPAAPPADVSKVAGASSMHMDMTHMQGLKGDAFDTMFIDMMMPHHEGAVLMSCEAHEKAGRDEIRKFARSVIKAQEREISELQSWKSAKKGAK